MSLTNYPNGVSSFGIPQIGDGIPSIAGRVFWVSSLAGKPGAPGTYEEPLDSIENAMGKCLDDRGDLILCKEGHVEPVASAGAVTLDIKGVSIVSLGVGDAKAQFQFNTLTTATVEITANNVKLLNFIGTPTVDGVVAPFKFTNADNCTIDLEWRDRNDVTEALRAILASGSDNLDIKLVYKGFTTGNAVVNAVRLTNCVNVNIDIDAYGVNSTAWVEFITTACTNVKVHGIMYTGGITNFTRDVVDTVGGSTWFAEIFDASFGGKVSGGSAAALASDDVSALAAQCAKLDLATLAVNPTAGSLARFIASGGTALGTQLADSKSIIDCFGTNGTTVTDSAVSILGAIGADNANNAFSSANVVSNDDGSVLERLEYVQSHVSKIDRVTLDVNPAAGSLARFIASGGTALGTPLADSKSLLDALGTNGTTVTDSAVSVLGAVGANNANNAFASNLVTGNEDGSVLERLEFMQKLLVPQMALNAGANPLASGTLFTYTGDIEVLAIYGVVTTAINVAVTTVKLQATPDALAAQDLCTTLDVSGFAAGSILTITGAAADAMLGTTAVGGKTTAEANRIFLSCVASGVISVVYGAATAGQIRWNMLWRPLSVLATVV